MSPFIISPRSRFSGACALSFDIYIIQLSVVLSTYVYRSIDLSFNIKIYKSWAYRPIVIFAFCVYYLIYKERRGDKVEKIKKMRKALKLTQQQFAIKIGVSSATFQVEQKANSTDKKLRNSRVFAVRLMI